jgi:1-acyl-sn-glycerol-3-phosphate acyltransferase
MSDMYPPPLEIKVIRRLIKSVAIFLMSTLSEFHIEGKENLPGKGPLLIVSNHFNMADPAAIMATLPWLTEYIAGTQTPVVPRILRWIPRLWNPILVHRGSASLEAMRRAINVLKKGGILVAFPEGGAWASVLRPARPGIALLAARSDVPILPIGIDGTYEVFPKLSRWKRALVRVKIGRVFGPLHANIRGRSDKEELRLIGDTIMSHISELIPPERRGYLSDDPAIREAAKGTENYPWDLANLDW